VALLFERQVDECESYCRLIYVRKGQSEVRTQKSKGPLDQVRSEVNPKAIYITYQVRGVSVLDLVVLGLSVLFSVIKLLKRWMIDYGLL